MSDKPGRPHRGGNVTDSTPKGSIRIGAKALELSSGERLAKVDPCLSPLYLSLTM